MLRLRISMPDQPGAVGRVATIIASHGGNITSIDAQQATSEFAVDEPLVDFSSEPDLTRLREDLAGDGDTLLVSQQVTDTIDPIVVSLGHVSELLHSRPTTRRRPWRECRRTVLFTCRLDQHR